MQQHGLGRLFAPYGFFIVAFASALILNTGYIRTKPISQKEIKKISKKRAKILVKEGWESNLNDKSIYEQVYESYLVQSTDETKILENMEVDHIDLDSAVMIAEIKMRSNILPSLVLPFKSIVNSDNHNINDTDGLKLEQVLYEINQVKHKFYEWMVEQDYNYSTKEADNFILRQWSLSPEKSFEWTKPESVPSFLVKKNDIENKSVALCYVYDKNSLKKGLMNEIIKRLDKEDDYELIETVRVIFSNPNYNQEFFAK
ncbi:MAG: hypothetical protein JXQ87_11300 [Bacteroidia bacterium]